MQSLPAAVNAPIFDSQGQGRYIQPIYLDKYSTELCAAACDKQTQWDRSQSADSCNYKTCVYANPVVSMVGVVWCDPLHHTTLECMVWCGVVPLVPHGAL
jgi:hypothetical protein